MNPHEVTRRQEETLGPLNLRLGVDCYSETGHTPSGEDSEAQVTTHEVRNPGHLHLTVADCVWANGERDIRTTERHASPERFTTLVNRVRLTVYDHEDLIRVPLKQVCLKGLSHVPHGTLHHATEEELDEGAQLDVRAALRESGATAIGTQADVIGDTTRNRGLLCALFTPDNTAGPLAAYCLTRILPVYYELKAE